MSEVVENNITIQFGKPGWMWKRIDIQFPLNYGGEVWKRNIRSSSVNQYEWAFDITNITIQFGDQGEWAFELTGI